MLEALDALGKNTKFADTSTHNVVKPELIESTFQGMRNFEGQIRSTFPVMVNELSSLRKALKIHFLHLSNAIKDGELIGKSTKRNNKGARRVLTMRDRLDKRDKLTPAREKKIWKMELRKLKNNLEYSLRQVHTLVVVLRKLATECMVTRTRLITLE